MAQKPEKNLTAKLPESSVKAGKIRPYDKVKVRWIDSVGGHTEGTESDVHPTLAAKLFASGKAVIIDVTEDTSGVAKVHTDEQVKKAKAARAALKAIPVLNEPEGIDTKEGK